MGHSNSICSICGKNYVISTKSENFYYNCGICGKCFCDECFDNGKVLVLEPDDENELYVDDFVCVNCIEIKKDVREMFKNAQIFDVEKIKVNQCLSVSGLFNGLVMSVTPMCLELIVTFETMHSMQKMRDSLKADNCDSFFTVISSSNDYDNYKKDVSKHAFLFDLLIEDINKGVLKIV